MKSVVTTSRRKRDAANPGRDRTRRADKTKVSEETAKITRNMTRNTEISASHKESNLKIVSESDVPTI